MHNDELLLNKVVAFFLILIICQSSKKTSNKKSIKNNSVKQTKKTVRSKALSIKKQASKTKKIASSVEKNPLSRSTKAPKKSWYRIGLWFKSLKKPSKREKENIQKEIDSHKEVIQKVEQITNEKYEKDRKEVKQLIDLHIDTILKVDSLLEEVKNNKTRDKDSGFFKYPSSINLSKKASESKKGSPFPEFLQTAPFPHYVLDFPEIDKSLSSASSFTTISVPSNSMENNSQALLNDEREESSEINLIDDEKEGLVSELIVEQEHEEKKSVNPLKWLFTGIDGFDSLLSKGIPAGSNIIVAGGPGCGKTIFCLQTIYNKASEGHDCVFLSMEERPERLRSHMQEFGYNLETIDENPDQIILRANGKGRISLKRLQPIRLARSIEALLEKASGTLPVDIDLVLDFIPPGFNTCLLTLDSISAIETAFSGTIRQYRIYIEQLFRYFEHMDITTFMVTESSEAPRRFSNTGVEEFLADGIFVFYNFQGIKQRTRGVEIYKLRGCPHSQKIVPMQITNNGILLSPDEVCREQSR
ncbi:MAG: ATPase domain-containing protein [Thermoplasmatota archaeon]